MFQALAEDIVRALVDRPEEVTVKVLEGEGTVVIEIKTHRDDTRFVIGCAGRMANALRTIFYSAGVKVGKRVTVEILD